MSDLKGTTEMTPAECNEEIARAQGWKFEKETGIWYRDEFDRTRNRWTYCPDYSQPERNFELLCDLVEYGGWPWATKVIEYQIEFDNERNGPDDMNIVALPEWIKRAWIVWNREENHG